jgi:hypothetical protein
MYRLGRSESAGGFVVKGAMMFLVWHDAPLRVTRDLDLLATRRPTPVLATGTGCPATDGIVHA